MLSLPVSVALGLKPTPLVGCDYRVKQLCRCSLPLLMLVFGRPKDKRQKLRGRRSALNKQVFVSVVFGACLLIACLVIL